MANIQFNAIDLEKITFLSAGLLQGFGEDASGGNLLRFSAYQGEEKFFFSFWGDGITDIQSEIYAGTFNVGRMAIQDSHMNTIVEASGARLTSAALRSFITGGDFKKLLDKLSYYDDHIHISEQARVAFGGSGNDTVVVDQSRAAWSVLSDGGQIYLRGELGSIALVSIENIKFSDGNLILDHNSGSAHIYRLYHTILGRPPSVEEFLKSSELLSQGSDINQVSHDIIYSKEFAIAHGEASFQNVLEAIYKNIFGNPPSPSDYEYWGSQIKNGEGTIESIAAGWADGQEAKSKFTPEGYIWVGGKSSREANYSDIDFLEAVFDEAFYLSHNQDVRLAGVSALEHYMQFGWKEGRDPNALFDTSFYLSANADVQAAGANPLAHYLQFGWQEGRDPSMEFSTTAYLAANPDVVAAGMNPLVHYLLYGEAEGRAIFAATPRNAAPHDLLVDAGFYLQVYEDVAAAGMDPVIHYQHYGWQEGRNPNAYFDTRYYLDRNPDVQAAGIDPLLHYGLFGWAEGRDPSTIFSTTAYLAANPDVEAAGMNPLLHYLLHGITEQRDLGLG